METKHLDVSTHVQNGKTHEQKNKSCLILLYYKIIRRYELVLYSKLIKYLLYIDLDTDTHTAVTQIGVKMASFSIVSVKIVNPDGLFWKSFEGLHRESLVTCHQPITSKSGPHENSRMANNHRAHGESRKTGGKKAKEKK